MDLSQYAELFLAESREHLGTFNQLLLDWEKRPHSTEPIGGIFRAVHTIKGMAATMGYGAVADLAHRTENLLDALRRGDRQITAATLDLLFQAADALQATVEASAQGREGHVDVSGTLATLDRATAEYGEGTVSEGGRPSAPVDLPRVGRAVKLVLASETPLKGARALIILKQMEVLGTVHSVSPAPEAFEGDDFDGRFGFRIETEADDTTIDQAVRRAGDVVDVSVGEEDEAQRAEAAAGRARHIRVDLRRLDSLMNLIGELVTARGRLSEVSAAHDDTEFQEVVVKISQLSEALQAEIIEARMTPVWHVFDRFPRLVRDVARQLGKQVAFRVEGKEIELDRALLDEIGDPLVHLLRNAVDHGIESPEERREGGKPAEGQIVLSAARESNAVAIRVADDGRGIDRAAILRAARGRGLVADDVASLSDEMLLRVLARPGFSMAATVSPVSGRGVGVDAVMQALRAVGGTVQITSEVGQGSTFTLRLPPTLAIVRAVLTRVGEQRFALPVTHVTETLALDAIQVTAVEGQDAVTVRDTVIPLVHLRRLLDEAGEAPRGQPVIVLQIGERRSGLVVDQVLGQQEIVVKSFDPPRGMLPIFSGATILGDGRPALILDAGGLV